MVLSLEPRRRDSYLLVQMVKVGLNYRCPLYPKVCGGWTELLALFLSGSLYSKAFPDNHTVQVNEALLSLG